LPFPFSVLCIQHCHAMAVLAHRILSVSHTESINVFVEKIQYTVHERAHIYNSAYMMHVNVIKVCLFFFILFTENEKQIIT
jgi:hypothetical protein